MPFCAECGHQLAESAKFCFECGAKVNPTSQSSEQQRRSFYDGELHKCPQCGEVLDSFTTKCPSCDLEIRGAQGHSNTQRLMKQLDDIEQTRTESKVSQRKVFEQKINLVRNFAIPNTKEDVLEFLILALSNIDMRVYGIDGDCLSKTEASLSAAWLAKSEQAYQKARILFKNSPEFSEIQKLYDQKMRRIKGTKIKTVVGMSAMIVVPILVIIILTFVAKHLGY